MYIEGTSLILVHEVWVGVILMTPFEVEIRKDGCDEGFLTQTIHVRYIYLHLP